jgi:ribosome-binding ATPase YchF (GTP1/OBG family)
MLIGVVGKPSSGKSTFFKAATLVNVEIADYPFTTIKPNHAVAHVRTVCAEKYFNTKCDAQEGFCRNGIRFVPVELLDVAGLVPGAHEGKGMGNQFLDDLRQGDCLIHVVDASGGTNEKGEKLPVGTHDPCVDVKFLEEELDMWYYNILLRAWPSISKSTTSEDAPKALFKQYSGLGATELMAKKSPVPKKPLRQWSEEELKTIAVYFRKNTKPLIIAANKCDVKQSWDNIKRMKQEFPDNIIIPCSSESEVALREADKKGLINYGPGSKDFRITKANSLNEKQNQALAFIKKNVMEKYGSTGVQEALDRSVFGLLGAISVYPVAGRNLKDKDGNVLPDCYLMPRGSKALDLAYKVHKDLGDKFVRAIDVKTNRTVGRDHALSEEDVIEIVSQK